MSQSFCVQIIIVFGRLFFGYHLFHSKKKKIFFGCLLSEAANPVASYSSLEIYGKGISFHFRITIS